ncbi:MAG TPA: hypothetical protein VIY70_02150 [Acidimicrobiia bacterium]
MDDRISLAAQQLARMRGMNARYHDRFFSDIRFSTLVTLALLTAGFAVDERLFLAIPPIALIGAAQTAFDASYLIFSRQYATRLEQHLNRELGQDLLVAHRLEDVYLFPLDERKIVTLSLSKMTWFGFMTAFYTAIGVTSYVVGVILSLGVIEDRGAIAFGGLYLIALAALTVLTLAVGMWWFVAGEGERRLKAVLDDAFGDTA